MWWLIGVGITLIGIWAYYTFFMKKKEKNTEEALPGGGVGPIKAFFRGLKIYSETTVIEADTGRTEAKVKSIQTETQRQAAQRAQDNLEVEGRRSDELREAQHLTSLAAEKDKQLDFEIRGHLFKAAAAKGLDITTYLQITSHKEMKQIDLQVRAEEYRQDQEQISRVQQEKLELVDRATHRLFSMYELRAKIAASKGKAKDAKLNQLNYNISIAERLIRGEQDRYLQAALGEETERALPPAQSEGDDSEESETDSEPVPAKRGRGRPRKTPAE